MATAIRVSPWVPVASLIVVAIVSYYRVTSSSGGLIAQAAFAYDKGEIEKAGSLARQQLKQAADDPLALRIAARVAARQERDDTALNLYSRVDVANLEPHDFSLMGRSLARSGNTERAIKAYETALEARPDDPEILDALAELEIQNDRHFAAEKLAARLAGIPSHQARGNLLLGVARDQLNDPAGSATALRRSFELDPALTCAGRVPTEPFRSLFIRSLLKSGQPAEARLFIEKVAGSSPTAEQSWLSSRALMQEGKWDQAASILRADPSYRTQHSLESEPAPYVGSARCSACHRTTSEHVLASRHATTFAYANDLASIQMPAVPLADPGNRDVHHTYERNGRQIQATTHASDQVFRAVAEYAFGSLDHFTSFVGSDEQGAVRMLRMSHFQSPRGSGWDLTTNLPMQPSSPDQYLGKTIEGNDGIRRCLTCHTTDFRAALDRQGPQSADHSIGCEGCHGPGGHHVAAVEAGFNDPAIAAPRNASAEQINTLCGRCHTMHKSQAVSAPRTDPLWMRFPSLTLTWSRCFTESDGKLNCLTCHDPHQNADTSVPRNEARCLSCHSSRALTSLNDPAHREERNIVLGTYAPCPKNPSSGCLECHMPRSWDPKTHSFKTDHYIRIR